MFKLPLLLKCKRNFFLWLAGVFVISAVDLLSTGSSFAEGRGVCEEPEQLRCSPQGGGRSGCGRDFGGEGGGGGEDLDRMRTGLAMAELGGKDCRSGMAGWDEKLPPDLSLPRAGAFPRGWGKPWAGVQ